MERRVKLSRTIFVAAALGCFASAFAQAWADSYEKALTAVRAQQWGTARAEFKAAASNRPVDQATPTRLPGPITEQRFWRNGSPYSPNFGAAYAGFKQATSLSDDAAKTALLNEVATEFEGLLARGQQSAEAYYFLAATYSNLRDVAKSQDLETRFQAAGGKFEWKLDPEIVTAEDRAAMGGMTPANPSAGGTTQPSNPLVGPVTQVQNKYALIIGNSEGRIENLRVPFAASDALVMREHLVTYCGYPEANIEVVSNATATEMSRVVNSLSERVAANSIVFIYYSGAGVNLDGKDFLAGIDATTVTDSSRMLPKMDVYMPFIRKGSTIFAFYQAHRPSLNGRFFGSEVPRVGAIAQTQATIPGSSVGSIVRGGNAVGIFTDAMASVLAELRSNRVPITEFGWNVFNRMRGSTVINDSGVGGNQVLTLPQLSNLDPRLSSF